MPLAVLGFDKLQILPDDTVRHFAFAASDGPSHTGVVQRIDWPENKPPVIVVKMKDGKLEKWHTTWTAKGPWDLEAPFTTDRGARTRRGRNHDR